MADLNKNERYVKIDGAIRDFCMVAMGCMKNFVPDCPVRCRPKREEM